MDRRRMGVAAVAAGALMLVVIATNVLGSWRLTPRFNLPFVPAKGTPPPPAALPEPAEPSMSGMPSMAPNEPLISQQTLETILTVIVVLVVIAAAVFVGGLLWRLRRSADADQDAPPQVSVHEVVRDAVQTARDYLLARRDTGDVARNIIGAWSALEDAAADSGHRRRPEHTPSEFTADLLTSTSGAGTEISELLGLYHRARYGTAEVVAALTTTDSTRAVTLLSAIADQMDDHPDAPFRRPHDDHGPEADQLGSTGREGRHE